MNHEAIKLPKQSVDRPYSRYARDAMFLFGQLCREQRIDKKMTVKNVGERAGLSRGLVHRIEKGDPGCAIGAVFEVAAVVGVPLFNAGQMTMTMEIANKKKILSLLPNAVRVSSKRINDDF